MFQYPGSMPGLIVAPQKPITSTKIPNRKFHGLGTDKEKAEKIATTANQRIAAAEAEHYLRQLDETRKQPNSAVPASRHG
jgi:hypothetical protein